MPSMTAPLFGPSVTFTSRVFGDLDGSSFAVAASSTSPPRLTEYLSPSKVTVLPLNGSADSFLPPASTDSNVQVPSNFLSSFLTSALSSACAPNAASTSGQSSVTSAIRIRVLLHLRTMTSPDPLEVNGNSLVSGPQHEGRHGVARAGVEVQVVADLAEEPARGGLRPAVNGLPPAR